MEISEIHCIAIHVSRELESNDLIDVDRTYATIDEINT